MINAEVQSELVDLVIGNGGLVRSNYESASHIEANLKIELPEAMKKSDSLLQRVSHFMVYELEQYRVSMIVATGGAVDLARNVASLGDWDFVEIGSNKDGKRKNFYLPEIYDLEDINRHRLGFVEDVSTTWGTVRRALDQTGIASPALAVTGWRRGVRAPVGMRNGSIRAYNVANNTLVPLEERVGFTRRGIINRSVPMMVSPGDIQDWIPEATVDL